MKEPASFGGVSSIYSNTDNSDYKLHFEISDTKDESDKKPTYVFKKELIPSYMEVLLVRGHLLLKIPEYVLDVVLVLVLSFTKLPEIDT